MGGCEESASLLIVESVFLIVEMFRNIYIPKTWKTKDVVLIIIIIMYIYCALINALSAHIIHINLNMIFYTHAEHSPIKNNLRIKYHTETHTHTHTAVNLNVHDTDRYRTSYMIMCFHNLPTFLERKQATKTKTCLKLFKMRNIDWCGLAYFAC